MEPQSSDSERIERVPVKKRPRVIIQVPEEELRLQSDDLNAVENPPETTEDQNASSVPTDKPEVAFELTDPFSAQEAPNHGEESDGLGDDSNSSGLGDGAKRDSSDTPENTRANAQPGGIQRSAGEPSNQPLDGRPGGETGQAETSPLHDVTDFRQGEDSSRDPKRPRDSPSSAAPSSDSDVSLLLGDDVGNNSDITTPAKPLVGSDLPSQSAGSDLPSQSAGVDLPANAVGSDLPAKAVENDLPANARSDLTANAVGSDLPTNAARSDLHPNGKWVSFDDDPTKSADNHPTDLNQRQNESESDKPLFEMRKPGFADEKQRSNPFTGISNPVDENLTNIDTKPNINKSNQHLNELNRIAPDNATQPGDPAQPGDPVGKSHADRSRDKPSSFDNTEDGRVPSAAGDQGKVVVVQPRSPGDSSFSLRVDGDGLAEEPRRGLDVEAGSRTSLADTTALLPRQGDWSTGLCQCRENCSEVCYADVCFPCSIYDLAQQMSQTDTRAPLCCLNCYLGDLRTRLRNMFQIKGEEDNDCCVTCWCAPCAIGQMRRELRIRGNSS